MIIIVTGTPGTGKTTHAKALAKRERYTYVDVNEVIKKNNKKINGIIIDSHLSHYLAPELVDRCMVMRCSDLKKLRKRLKKRGYSLQKIKENLEAELMETCLQEAMEKGHRVEIIDGT